MNLILDTHTFIWWDSEPSKLSPRARAACQDPSSRMILSVASVWEMQIKHGLGKLTLKRPLAEIVEEQQRTNGIEVLPVGLNHVLALAALPRHHDDPFDRILIAQACIEEASLVTKDPQISR